MKAFAEQVYNVSFIVGVLGNLTASILIGIGPLIHLHAKVNRNHKELLRKIDADGNGKSGS